MPILHVKDEEFKEVLRDNPQILVDFYANWCGPCKMIAPILEELAAEGHVIAKVDTDQETQVTQEYEIESIPTLMVFKDGKMVNRHSGYASKAYIEELLK